MSSCLQVSKLPQTQQRLVHRQTFEMPEVKQFVEELSVDGVRFASALPGNPALGKNTRGALARPWGYRGIFPRQRCPDRVGHQPLASPITCLGDGHDGVWNIIDEILTVNVILVSLNGEFAQGGWVIEAFEASWNLALARQVDAAKALFADCTKQAQNFINYLDKHCDRIVNYQYYQAEQICSIGSGAVESAVKQIDRTKISGAQWNKENVPQCWLTAAYLKLTAQGPATPRRSRLELGYDSTTWIISLCEYNFN